jgi:hypothetical protein
VPIAIGVNDAGDKFAAGANGTVGQKSPQYQIA